MANNENYGSGLRASLALFEETRRDELSPYWERVKKLLGHRVDCMFYLNSEEPFNDGYITQILAGSKSTLGLEVTASLRTMMPVCKEGHPIRPIVVEDHKGLENVLNVAYKEDGKWEIDGFYTKIFVKRRTIDLKPAVFEDDYYLVLLIDQDSEIMVHIYKK